MFSQSGDQFVYIITRKEVTMSKKAVDLGLKLIGAVKENNVEELKLLIEKGADDISNK